MKYFTICFCLAAFAIGEALSQDDVYVIDRQGSVLIMPYYQRWSVSDNFDFSELATVISLTVPAGKEWNFTLRGLPASVTGDVTHLSGYTDTQLGLTYHMENPDIVFCLGVNVPTGKKELTQDEFGTSILLSNSVFNLQAPNFGQGLNITPGLVYALALNDELVAGLGVSYQYKGSYKTLANYDEYDPGDEIAVTGGLDVRLGEATNLSAGIVVTTYGTDKLGPDEVLAPSTKIAVNAQFNKTIGSNELSLSGQYVLKGSSKFTAGNLMIDETDKIEPNRFDLVARYAVRISEQVVTTFAAQGRFYQESQASFTGKHLFGVGLEPNVELSNSITVPVKLMYQTGELNDGTKLSSVSGGLGVMLKF